MRPFDNNTTLTTNEQRLARQLATLLTGITEMPGMSKRLMTTQFHQACIESIEKAGMHEGNVNFLKVKQQRENP